MLFDRGETQEIFWRWAIRFATAQEFAALVRSANVLTGDGEAQAGDDGLVSDALRKAAIFPLTVLAFGYILHTERND